MGRRGHGGHHGGAWKVAYADFTTSMMALFIVLWLISSDQEVRESVQKYFKGQTEDSEQGTKGRRFAPDAVPRPHQPADQPTDNLLGKRDLQRAAEKLMEQLDNSSIDGEDTLRFEFLADGIRIVAMDKNTKPFFEPNSDKLTKFGSWVLQTIAWEIERYPFQVEVEGHTQRGKEGSVDQTLSWDLSSARAVAARDALQFSGVNSKNFFRIAGYADRAPLDAAKPDDDANRRIAIIVRPKSDYEMPLLQNQLRER